MKTSVIILFYGKAHLKKHFLVMDIANVRGSVLRSGLFGGTVAVHVRPHNQKQQMET